MMLPRKKLVDAEVGDIFLIRGDIFLLDGRGWFELWNHPDNIGWGLHSPYYDPCTDAVYFGNAYTLLANSLVTILEEHFESD